MIGTTALALAFSGYVVWTMKATYMSPEDAKEEGFTAKGKLLGLPCYFVPPDEKDEMIKLAGTNILTDQMVTSVFVGLQIIGGWIGKELVVFRETEDL